MKISLRLSTANIIALCVGVIFFIALAAQFSVAHAATGLSIQPVKIDETILPGNSLRGEILLTNAGDSAVDVFTKTEDFMPSDGADSIQFVGRAEGVTSVRDWITIDSKESFILGLGESRKISYTITAPPNAEPGSHFGVVLFKATPKAGSGGSLKVGTQVGMLVLIAIPGNHLEKGEILSFSAPLFQQHGPVPFAMEFKNTGTVHFEPKGTITVYNLFGTEAAKIPITGQVVLPTSVKKLSFQWHSNPFSIGRYTAVATVYDGEGTALTSKAVSFWILPMWYILGFFVTLLLVYLVVRYLKRHLRISLVSN